MTRMEFERRRVAAAVRTMNRTGRRYYWACRRDGLTMQRALHFAQIAQRKLAPIQRDQNFHAVPQGAGR